MQHIGKVSPIPIDFRIVCVHVSCGSFKAHVAKKRTIVERVVRVL